MSDFRRFAVYYLPDDPALAAFGARWLGWDAVRGVPVEQFDLLGGSLSEVTGNPRKYGFHGTLKAPFRLAEGRSPEELQQAVGTLAASLGPVSVAGMGPKTLDGFLALMPLGDLAGLEALAFRCVSDLDGFRAALTEAEVARRRPELLTERQRALLTRWGYPYVGEEFRFHMTLTGQHPAAVLEEARQVVLSLLRPLPRRFVFRSVSLAGERADGMFVQVQRYALTG